MLGGLDHAEHVDHAGDVAELVEVDQVDHAPDRPVCEREHVASHDWCRRMSDPEIAAVRALQSELDAHLHAASMPSTPAERSDPIVSYLANTVSTTFVRVPPPEEERLLLTRRLIVDADTLMEAPAPTEADGVIQVIE